MENKYTFITLITEVFAIEKRPLGYKEIWESAVKNQLDKKLNSKGKTPWDSIGAQLYVDIRDNPKSIFTKVSSKPTKFYLKSKSDEYIQTNLDQEISKDYRYKERDLHVLLAYYLFNSEDFFGARSKTIYHEKSTKQEKGRDAWIHPDVVAVNLPNNLDDKVKKLSEISGISIFKVYSFELKKEINFSNYKEYFFQAVSNSSWAHEGYLVVANLDLENKEFMKELSRLSTTYGIGILHLNVKEPIKSNILQFSKEKETIDFDSIQELISKNSDFKDFIHTVVDSYTTNRTLKESFDKLLTTEEIEKYIKEKNF